MKRILALPIYVKILSGMLLGIFIGFAALSTGGGEFVTVWVKPLGLIFMNALKFVAIPLIVVSLIQGVASLGNIASLSRIGIKTIAIYVGTTILAVLVGLGFVFLFSPGNISNPELLRASVGEAVTADVASLSSMNMLSGIVPENLVEALSNNDNMLQVIFIALVLGIATLMVGHTKSRRFVELIDSLSHIVLKIVDLIMMTAPIGVMALMAGTVVDSAGSLEVLGALGMYALTVVCALLFLVFIVYPLFIKFFSNIPLQKFFRELAPIQLIAFSTSSSAATLPFTLETVEQKLGVSKQVSSFVLPVGVTINMDGTSCYQVVAAVFIAQIMGVDLGWSEILILIATTTISSIGTPGIPGGSIVILMMVLSSIGVPPEGMVLIMGVDRPLDMLRTVVNVTGDTVVSSVVDASEGRKKR